MTSPSPAGKATTMSAEQPGQIEIDRSGRTPRVRFALPQEWFTLAELRQFAAFLTLVADEDEPTTREAG